MIEGIFSQVTPFCQGPRRLYIYRNILSRILGTECMRMRGVARAYMGVEMAHLCCSVCPAAESAIGTMVMSVSPSAAKLPMVSAWPERAGTVMLLCRRRCQ